MNMRDQEESDFLDDFIQNISFYEKSAKSKTYYFDKLKLSLWMTIDTSKITIEEMDDFVARSGIDEWMRLREFSYKRIRERFDQMSLFLDPVELTQQALGLLHETFSNINHERKRELR